MGNAEEKTDLQEVADRISYVVEAPTPLPVGELRKFILALCDNRIFTSAHLRAHESSMLGMVFMPVVLGMFRDHTEKEMAALRESIGVFYEYYDKAGPRSINGLPCFFSVRMLCRTDWERAQKAYKIEMDRRESLVIPD